MSEGERGKREAKQQKANSLLASILCHQVQEQVQEVQVPIPVPVHEVQAQVQVQSRIAQNFIILNITQKSFPWFH